MTLLAEPSGDGVSLDTQPFDFIGSDLWGSIVRGRIEAADAASAASFLRSRGISAKSVNDGGEAMPYRVELTIARRTATVVDLVRRVITARVENAQMPFK